MSRVAGKRNRLRRPIIAMLVMQESTLNFQLHNFIGSKRKAASVQGDEAQNETFVGEGDDSLVTAIDREIEREIADIKAGRHPHVQQSVEALEKARQKKIDASDRHRKLQIRNIEALYEYEVEDATALYNVRALLPNLKYVTVNPFYRTTCSFLSVESVPGGTRRAHCRAVE